MNDVHALIIGGCLLALTGCASVAAQKSSADATAQNATAEKPATKAASPSFTAEREQRKKMVAKEFDLQRDRAQYQAALGRWEQGDVAGCRQALATLLARNPDHRDGQLLAAQIDLFDGKPKSALEHARHVLVELPNDAQAHYQAALALDAMGQMADAVPHYEQAARLGPGEEVYQASYQAAIGSAILPPRDGAAANTRAGGDERIDRATNVVPTAYDGDSTRDDHADERLASLRKAVEDHPDDQQAALDASVYALRVGQPQAALETIAAALREHPDSAALLRVQGTAQYQCGDFPAARASLGRAISLDKSNALAYFLMGSALARMGESEAARPYFDEAARLDPRYRNN
jgi:tetratricopeptide (TPR) repeat protein